MVLRTTIGWRELVAVFAGGMLGTTLRLVIDLLLPHGDADFPLGTLLINLVGSFVLGLLVSTLWTRSRTPNWLKAGLGTGLIGSFTTFSAIMFSLVAEASSGAWGLAALYLIASVVLGLAAALGGLLLGSRLPAPIDWEDE